MLLSKSCEYGLRASLFLVACQNGQFISIREMSDKLDISFHFLTKTLQQLTGAGLMESHKGPNGGIRLIKPGSEISLFDIITAIDGRNLFTECVLGLPGCGTQKPCPMHHLWGDTRENIQDMLSKTTLDELAEKGRKGNLRITMDGKFVWG